MAAGLISVLRRALDIFFFVFVAAAALALVVYWRVARRRWRAKRSLANKRQEPVMISITADSIALTQQLNDRDSVEVFYTRPLFARVIVLHVGRAPHRLVRLGRRVIGLDHNISRISEVRKFLPLSAMLIAEVTAVRCAMAIMRIEGGNHLEVMSPGPMIFQAMLIKSLTGCRLTTQVRGNVDLLSESMGRYFYCRLPRGWAPVRAFAGTVHHSISDSFHRRCDLVIGYNVNNLQSAISNGAAPGKTRLMRIEVDENMLDVPPARRGDIEGFPQQGKVVAIWSRLDPNKRLREAVEAFLLFAGRYGGVTLLVIGDGPARGEIEAMVARQGFSDRVRFAGYRNHDYIGGAAPHIDAAIVPYGGSSLVEAALMSLPVVAFDIEWHSELIRPGETGYLADYPDREHMAALLAQALDDDGEAIEMARRCRELALRMFDRAAAAAVQERHMAALIAMDRVHGNS